MNRTERTRWPEHDRKDRSAGRGQPRQDSHKRNDSRERSVSKDLPEQVSLKVNLDDNIKCKRKFITQSDDSIYVIIQPMITANVQDTQCYHPAR